MEEVLLKKEDYQNCNHETFSFIGRFKLLEFSIDRETNGISQRKMEIQGFETDS